MTQDQKPKRLMHKTYLQLVKNSVGTAMFRNWYVKEATHEFDAMSDGKDSCAFFVSSVLKIFSQISALHGTTNSLVKDLQEFGWAEVSKPAPGDVLIWEPLELEGRPQEHAGFYIGQDRAISTSWAKRVVAEHDWQFAPGKRKVTKILRLGGWDDDT